MNDPEVRLNACPHRQVLVSFRRGFAFRHVIEELFRYGAGGPFRAQPSFLLHSAQLRQQGAVQVSRTLTRKLCLNEKFTRPCPLNNSVRDKFIDGGIN